MSYPKLHSSVGRALKKHTIPTLPVALQSIIRVIFAHSQIQSLKSEGTGDITQLFSVAEWCSP